MASIKIISWERAIVFACEFSRIRHFEQVLAGAMFDCATENQMKWIFAFSDWIKKNIRGSENSHCNLVHDKLFRLESRKRWAKLLVADNITSLFARSVIRACEQTGFERPSLRILTFMTAMLKAWRISSGVDNRTPSSLLDFRRRWAPVKAPESLSVSVSFSDAWKCDSTLKPLRCTIPSGSLLVDCMFISVRIEFISPGMFVVATCMNKRDVLPCKTDLLSTTYAARKLLINIGEALSKIPLAKKY